HLATGNYNPGTAKIYTDLGIITSAEQFGADATDLFNFLTGYSLQDNYEQLLVAPLNLRDRLIALIRREAKHKKAGKLASIVVKCNSITDEGIVDELYAASKAGVEIDLIIRGICTLRPGIKGLSENIRVRSVVGRFLEHSRVFWFANDTSPEVYIGSADLMHRNMDRRVEVLTPIRDAEIARYLKEVFLENYLKDQINSRTLRSDGTYKRVANRTSGGFDSQMAFVGKEIDS
nr:phospholipase D-like domain-containing protein [Pyrinomonadaceae bacterium]